MAGLRSDSARNRAQILDAARLLGSEGRDLQLNAVARAAGVGVGTVYRHFASPDALTEGLVEQRFIDMTREAVVAAQDPDALAALRGFLTQSLETFVADSAFARTVTAANFARPETGALRQNLISAFSDLVHRAADHFDDDLDPLDFMILVCGLSYSARLRPERSRRYLDALLRGLMR